MPGTIQIRNVSEELHRVLKSRAARAGQSLSDYLRQEIEALAARPTMEELIERMRSREPVKLSESAADAVRAERDGR